MLGCISVHSPVGLVGADTSLQSLLQLQQMSRAGPSLAGLRHAILEWDELHSLQTSIMIQRPTDAVQCHGVATDGGSLSGAHESTYMPGCMHAYAFLGIKFFRKPSCPTECFQLSTSFCCSLGSNRLTSQFPWCFAQMVHGCKHHTCPELRHRWVQRHGVHSIFGAGFLYSRAALTSHRAVALWRGFMGSKTVLAFQMFKVGLFTHDMREHQHARGMTAGPAE